MSRHSIITTTESGVEVYVVIGYDRPLNFVFCTVERGKDSDDMLYSNLDDENAGTSQQDVRYYESVLADLNINIPEVMYEQVKSDQHERIGNRLVAYRQDGIVIEEFRS